MVSSPKPLSLKELKNRHVGKRAFIIGSGPSLRLADLDRLTQEITFACNKIYLAFSDTHWRPTYYTVEDHLVAIQNRDKIENLNGVIKFFPHTLALHGVEFADSLTYRFLWKDVYPKLPEFSNDAEKGLYWGSTVVYTMMQMACYMGIRELYLLGIDFHFIVPANESGTTGKFKVYVCEGEQNHFHPDYRKPGERWHQPNLHYQKKAFLAAKQFAADEGLRIFNTTRGGRLEVFPRRNLDDVLGE